MAEHIEPQQISDLKLPKGDTCCDISIINTTTNIVCATNALLEPSIRGHEVLNLPTYAFHIRNQHTAVEIMFDLGARKDWWNLAPSVKMAIVDTVPGLRVDKGIDEILTEGGHALQIIKAIVVSHWHWDHLGDPSRFPSTTALVVGPGFKQSFMPGYPEQKTGLLLETDFAGREVHELDFSNAPKIGQFPAFDYFGDGSLYILDVPGHAVGHISALVRDTPSTFVFLGGDITHFGGAFRPTPYVPLPPTIPYSTILDSDIPSPCPCTFFTSSHPVSTSNSANADAFLTNARTSPFYGPSTAKGSWYIDPVVAKKSIDNLFEFDASPDVLVALAHDPDSGKYFEFFPNSTMNGWKKKTTSDARMNWKAASHWSWLNELPRGGKPGRPPLVDGRWDESKQQTRALDDVDENLVQNASFAIP